MKSLYYLMFITFFLLTACSPAASDTDIQTAIAQTQAAQPSQTPIPTSTPEPTLTPTVTDTPQPTNTSAPKPTNTSRPTNTPTVSIEELRLEFSQIIAEAIPDNIEDVDSVTMARIANGRFEIELKTIWASRDRQPNISYDVIRFIALVMNDVPENKANILVDNDVFSVYLVTYSIDGDYRYESTTDFDTLMKLNNLSISYEEWVTLSNAGFR